MSIEEFLRARIEEEKDVLESAESMKWVTGGEFKALMGFMKTFERILDWHDKWPVLVERPMRFETPNLFDDYDPAKYVSAMTYSMTQEIAWMTHKSYVETFGEAPPAAPILRMIAMNWATHADFNDDWKVE